MLKPQIPRELHGINRFAVRAMIWLNGFAHIIIGLALAIAVLMFTWLFFQDVRQAASAHNLVHGFLHALGTLMLLWSVSALITTEIRYLLGSQLEVEAFIEVAMIVVLRKLIVMPVEDATPLPTAATRPPMITDSPVSARVTRQPSSCPRTYSIDPDLSRATIKSVLWAW